MTTTIQKWGNSQGIRLPKFVLEQLGFSENEEVELIVREEDVLIKKATEIKKHKTLEQRLVDFYGKDIDTILKEHANDYQATEIDWGKPMGDELW